MTVEPAAEPPEPSTAGLSTGETPVGVPGVATEASAASASATLEGVTIVPVRHLGRFLAGAVVAVVAAMLVHSLVTNPRFQWQVVSRYLTAHSTLAGLSVTVELTVLSMAIGVVLGTMLAILRLSPNPLLTSSSWAYVWLFRGTPVIVQILFWNFIAALYPQLSFGVPFGPELAHGNANTLVTPFTAAILGLGLNEAAYMAEIVRAGILSVPPGQSDAGFSLGLTRLQVLRAVVLPQAMRVIVPPTGNEVISMLKTSSLASVIAVTELLYSVQIVYSRTFEQVPLLIVAVIWYLALTTVLSNGQFFLERHFARGSAQATPPRPLDRIRRALVPSHDLPALSTLRGERR